ncbi:hypothetical protein J6590_033207 [Homalodisca vitripennis]|nr:hypothetical protein J6590_033207 [Homalodisca vitripennis]
MDKLLQRAEGRTTTYVALIPINLQADIGEGPQVGSRSKGDVRKCVHVTSEWHWNLAFVTDKVGPRVA